MTKTFEITDEEQLLIDRWMNDHLEVCPLLENSPTGLRYCGAIGGADQFLFVPTGLGVITKFRCGCGEEIDITDYASW